MSEEYEKELNTAVRRLLQPFRQLDDSPGFLFGYYKGGGCFFIGRWREKLDKCGNDYGGWEISIEKEPLDEVDEIMGGNIQFDSIDHISEYGLLIAFRDAITKFENEN